MPTLLASSVGQLRTEQRAQISHLRKNLTKKTHILLIRIRVTITTVQLCGEIHKMIGLDNVFMHHDSIHYTADIVYVYNIQWRFT